MDAMKRQFSWLGGGLILFGTLMLLRKFHLIHLQFSQIVFGFMILWGLVQVGRGFAAAIGGKVFWGTILFLFGVFFFLKQIDSLDIGGHMVVPSAFLILGIAFFMMWMNNVRDWYLIAPALFFGGVGVAFMASELGYLSYWDVWEMLHRYWPVVIIMIGLAIMFKRNRYYMPPPTNPPSTPPPGPPPDASMGSPMAGAAG